MLNSLHACQDDAVSRPGRVMGEQRPGRVMGVQHVRMMRCHGCPGRVMGVQADLLQVVVSTKFEIFGLQASHTLEQRFLVS